MIVQVARVIAVVALLCAAAAISTPKGRLPLVLRGLRRVIDRDAGNRNREGAQSSVPLARRLLAFLLAIIALLVAISHHL